MSDEFYQHFWKPVPALSLSEALAIFVRQYGYEPRLVIVHPGTPVSREVRVIERREVPAGTFYCALEEVQL